MTRNAKHRWIDRAGVVHTPTYCSPDDGEQAEMLRLDREIEADETASIREADERYDYLRDQQ